MVLHTFYTTFGFKNNYIFFATQFQMFELNEAFKIFEKNFRHFWWGAWHVMGGAPFGGGSFRGSIFSNKTMNYQKMKESTGKKDHNALFLLKFLSWLLRTLFFFVLLSGEAEMHPVGIWDSIPPQMSAIWGGDVFFF